MIDDVSLESDDEAVVLQLQSGLSSFMDQLLGDDNQRFAATHKKEKRNKIKDHAVDSFPGAQVSERKKKHKKWQCKNVSASNIDKDEIRPKDELHYEAASGSKIVLSERPTHLESLADDLGLNTPFHGQGSSDMSGPDRTMHLIHKDGGKTIEVVEYHSHKKKARTWKTDEGEKSLSNQNNDGLLLKDLRHEVVQFSISGSKGGDKHAAKQQLAIKLGAKPPKPFFVNYKELMAQKAVARKEEIERRKVARALGEKAPKVGSKNKKRNVKRDINAVPLRDGQLGKYKGGVQVLGKKDVWRIRGNKSCKKTFT